MILRKVNYPRQSWILRTGLDSTLWITDFRFWIPNSMSLELSRAEFRIFLKAKLGFQSSGLKIPKENISQIPDDLRLRAVSLFFRFSEGSAHASEMQETRRETCLSRAFSHALGHLRVSRVLHDGLRKKRHCSYSRMITIHGAPDS